MSQVLDRTRIQDIDALRGFALLGILIVNITFAASGFPIHLAQNPAYDSWLDHAVHWLSSAFVDMKFYLLFSFLFGYSFQLQMEAAQRAGAAFRPRMLRRLGGLFVLGALHGVFLITGDILSVYAIIGLVLLAMRRVKDRTALLVAGVIYVYLFITLAVAALFVDSTQFMDPTTAVAAAQETTANLAGSFSDVIGEHVRALPTYGLSLLTVQGPTTLAAFLIGMVSGRRRLLQNTHGADALLRLIQLVGFAIGITGGLVYASGGNGDTRAVLMSVMTAPFLTAAYVASLLRIMHSDLGQDIRQLLAPAGQMALSNYLGQSVATMVIFTGVGFGLAGQVSPLETVGLAVGIFVLQVLLSHVWLSSFRYGRSKGCCGRSPTRPPPAGGFRPRDGRGASGSCGWCARSRWWKQACG
ncbi:uncharacterized protein EV649_5703 [Kribbella sp. VKM Ac-2569]|uniref:DUF418 domain-containing protein n=1 Tax=Kribbella sp. VKM Ac-2569 TaxID=2512220 RepID=UPI00102CE230|nr:DUF418 domain-containing protein [Kribbella sp. VKM Ac-2569]RZT14923.1 uncharacterized protein EV649_5703 [Kribbella sp. VKM Ac-2569]